MTGVKKVGGDWSKKGAAEAMDKKVLIGDAVDNYKSKADGKPAIVFCTNIKHAQHVKEAFTSAGYKFDIITGDTKTTPKHERKRITEALGKHEIDGVISVDCLSEGADIPRVEVAILMRPTMSLSKYLQQVGRVLRVHEDKAYAIILDHAGNSWEHGMPCDVRDWSLSSPIKKKKKKGEDGKASPWRECPECYGYIPSTETVCPQCGAEYIIKSQEIIETVSGELEIVINGFDEEVLKTERINMLQAIGINNMTDSQIREFGKLKGYKSGWAYLQIKRRKEVYYG